MILGGALIAVAAFLLLSYEPPEPAAPPPVVRPAKTMVLESLADVAARSFTARVKAAREVDLSFRVSGPLIAFDVRADDEVPEGAVLARLDPRDFQVELRNIEAQLDIARAQLAAMKTGARPEDLLKLRAEVARAEGARILAKSEYDSFREAAARNAVSALDFERKAEALQRAESQLIQAQESLRIGEKGARQEDLDAKEAEIRALEAARDASQDRLADTYLRAPFAGTIARTYVENFQDVHAKQPILSLQDVSRVEIVADIPESVVAVTKKDTAMRIVARFDYFPDRDFPVEILEAEAEADTRTQTFAVTCIMDAPEDVNIRPGMSATVQVEFTAGAGGAEGEWLIPADAVLADDSGSPTVWKVDPVNMTVRSVKIETGGLRGGRIVVSSGLAAGDRIVTAGVRLLQEGQKIRLLEEKAP
jgi:RND family efflux transporter MFP subunit